MTDRPLTVKGAADPEVQRITARVDDFCKMSGMSRRMVFNQIKAGKLKKIKMGSMTLIDVEAYRQMIAEERRRQS
jgi:hypothetical protein